MQIVVQSGTIDTMNSINSWKNWENCRIASVILSKFWNRCSTLHSTLKYLKISKLRFRSKVIDISAVATLKTDKMLEYFDEGLVDMIGRLTALYGETHT
jgi:hypothetical protein